ncbi:hypothetical protein BH11PLA2_BH11PLA2_43900 [soil metagenome]
MQSNEPRLHDTIRNALGGVRLALRKSDYRLAWLIVLLTVRHLRAVWWLRIGNPVSWAIIAPFRKLSAVLCVTWRAIRGGSNAN